MLALRDFNFIVESTMWIQVAGEPKFTMISNTHVHLTIVNKKLAVKAQTLKVRTIKTKT